MSIQYHIGAKIICVNDQYDKHPLWPENFKYPVLNEVYTIREIIVNARDVTFLLEEIINEPIKWDEKTFIEVSWFSWHFRPVKETDISVFTAMLNLPPKQIHKFQVDDLPRRKVFQEEKV